MKVLDIIVETGVGDALGYAWKFFGKQTAKAALGREIAQDVAYEILRKYPKKGLPVDRMELDRMLDARISASLYKNDTEFMEQVERETVGYYNKLYKDWKKTAGGGKIEPTAGDVAGAGVKKAAALAKTKWEALGSNGLIRAWSAGIFVWQIYDVQEAVTLYWEQMAWALDKLAVGPDATAEDGKPGFTLEEFHVYHKTVLAKLAAQLLATYPSFWYKIPILGWLFKLSGLVGRTLWMTFLDTHSFGNDTTLRQYINNFMMWKLNAFLPIFDDTVTVASVVGQPLVWTEDFVKNVWVRFLKNTAYQDSEIPAHLLPTNYPNPNNPADAAADKKKQNAKVSPTDADSQADTDPSKTDTNSRKRLPNKNPNGDWEDMGNGFEVNRMSNHVRVKRY